MGDILYNLVESTINKLSLNDIFTFASNSNIKLSNEEAQFILSFLRSNWYSLLKNQDISILDKYKGNFSPENFRKIKDNLLLYKNKYGRLFR